MRMESEIEALWRDDVNALKVRTEGFKDAKDLIAFYGSSSIRMWETLAGDLAPLNTINLGFGGSSYFLCNHFFDEIFELISPSQVVLYAGDNDLGSEIPEHEILTNIDKLINKILARYHKIPIFIISVKPSPDRLYLKTQIESLNSKILEAVNSKDTLSFIDIYHPMLDSHGQVQPSLYLDDELHMNSNGYEIWKSTVRNSLI